MFAPLSHNFGPTKFYRGGGNNLPLPLAKTYSPPLPKANLKRKIAFWETETAFETMNIELREEFIQTNVLTKL